LSWKTQPILIRFLTFFFLLFACEDKDDAQELSEAILIWDGEYASDGCGFSVELNGKTYKPFNESNIGAEFKENHKTTVIIEYSLPNKMLEYLCGDAPSYQKKDAIDIISIKKKN